MSHIAKLLTPEQLRQTLTAFWDGALTINTTRDGLAAALPQTDAEGWQIVIELSPGPPGIVRITDSGRTLASLIAKGQNIEADTVAEHIRSVLQQATAERDGTELYRWLKLPIDPIDVHVFTEALSAISHLSLLHEPAVRKRDVADQTLLRVFSDRQLSAQAGATLDGYTEKKVRVDYLVQPGKPVAFEILRRRRNILPVMEQWGYRWQDLRRVHTNLMPVMLFDPDTQDVDQASRAIGEDVCSLFCGYQETDRIHDILEKAAA